MKFFIFLLILTFFSAASYGQISVGLNAGILVPAQADNKFTAPHYAYKAGAEFMIKFSDHWQFRTGIDYASFNFKREFMNVDNVGNKNGTGFQYNTASYLGIPIAIRYKFNDRKFSPFIELGVSSMLKVSDQSKVENYKESAYNEAYNYHPTRELSANSILLSPSLGGGLNYQASEKLYLSFLVNYNYQVTPIYTYDSIRYNNAAAVLSVGYKL